MGGFPGSTSSKEPPVSAGDLRDLGWKYPLEEGTQPTLVFLPGESHGQRSLLGYSPQGHKESATAEVT